MVRQFVASFLALLLLAALVAAAVPAFGATFVEDDEPEADPGPPASFAACRAAAAGDLNLRAAPGTTAAVLAVIPAETPLTLAGEAKDGFVPVVHDGALGWVFAAYVAPAGVTAVAGAEVATAAADLNLRAAPTTGAEVLAVVAAGRPVVILDGGSDGFARVAYDGRIGYAASRYLVETED